MFQPLSRLEHERFAQPVDIEHGAMRDDPRRAVEPVEQAKPLHGVGVVHLPAHAGRCSSASHGMCHPARHAVTQRWAEAAQLPGQGQPELIEEYLPLRFGRQRPEIRARVVIANVHSHQP